MSIVYFYPYWGPKMMETLKCESRKLESSSGSFGFRLPLMTHDGLEHDLWSVNTFRA